MKKALHCTIACLFLAFAANAQVSRGTVLLGGSLGFSKTESVPELGYSTKYKSANVTPAFGVAIKENLVVGIMPGFIYGYNESNHKTNGTVFSIYNKTNGYTLSTFLRKYYPVAKKLYLFGDASINYGNNKLSQKNSSLNQTYFVTNKTNSLNLGLEPGLAYAFTIKFHIEAGLGNLLNIGFSNQKLRSSPDGDFYESNNFNISTSLSSNLPLHLGFRFLLPRK